MDKEENKPLVPKIPTLKDSKTPTVKIKGLAAGPSSLIARLKQFKQKDLAFISAGLGVLFMAPLAEHFMMAPENGSAGSSFKEGWGFRDGAGALGRGASPYEGGVNGLAPGGYLGGGADVITPLNVRDPSALVMGPNQTAPVPVSAPQAPPSKPEPSWKDALASSASRGAKEAIKAASPVPKIPLQGGLRGLGAVSGGGGGGGYTLPPISAGNVPNTASGSRALTRVTPATGYKGAAGARGPDNTSTGALENLKKAAAGAAGEMNRGGSAAGNLDSASAASNFPSGQQGDGGASGGTGGADKSASQNQGTGSKSGGGESLAFAMKKARMEKDMEIEYAKKKRDAMFWGDLKNDSIKTFLTDALVKPGAELIGGIFKIKTDADAIGTWYCYVPHTKFEAGKPPSPPAFSISESKINMKGGCLKEEAGKAKFLYCFVPGDKTQIKEIETGTVIGIGCWAGKAATEPVKEEAGAGGAAEKTKAGADATSTTRGGAASPDVPVVVNPIIAPVNVGDLGKECGIMQGLVNPERKADKDSGVAVSKTPEDKKAIVAAAQNYLTAAQKAAVAAAALTGADIPAECKSGATPPAAITVEGGSVQAALINSKKQILEGSNSLSRVLGAVEPATRAEWDAQLQRSREIEKSFVKGAGNTSGMNAEAVAIDKAIKELYGSNNALDYLPEKNKTQKEIIEGEKVIGEDEGILKNMSAKWMVDHAAALGEADKGSGDKTNLTKIQEAKKDLEAAKQSFAAANSALAKADSSLTTQVNEVINEAWSKLNAPIEIKDSERKAAFEKHKPVIEAVLNKLRGPQAVEGGATAYDKLNGWSKNQKKAVELAFSLPPVTAYGRVQSYATAAETFVAKENGDFRTRSKEILNPGADAPPVPKDTEAVEKLIEKLKIKATQIAPLLTEAKTKAMHRNYMNYAGEKASDGKTDSKIAHEFKSLEQMSKDASSSNGGIVNILDPVNALDKPLFPGDGVRTP